MHSAKQTGEVIIDSNTFHNSDASLGTRPSLQVRREQLARPPCRPVSSSYRAGPAGRRSVTNRIRTAVAPAGFRRRSLVARRLAGGRRRTKKIDDNYDINMLSGAELPYTQIRLSPVLCHVCALLL